MSSKVQPMLQSKSVVDSQLNAAKTLQKLLAEAKDTVCDLFLDVSRAEDFGFKIDSENTSSLVDSIVYCCRFSAASIELETQNCVLKEIAANLQNKTPMTPLNQFFAFKLDGKKSSEMDASDHRWVQEVYEIAGEDTGSAAVIDNDEEIQMTQADVNLKCPITGAILIDPVKSSTCNHTYGSIAVQNWLKQKKVCPVAGCNRPLAKADLEVDRKMVRLLGREAKKKHLSRQ